MFAQSCQTKKQLIPFLFSNLNCLSALLITICMYCDGCDTKALNCKPITNLKEKTELSNLQ